MSCASDTKKIICHLHNPILFTRSLQDVLDLGVAALREVAFGHSLHDGAVGSLAIDTHGVGEDQRVCARLNHHIAAHLVEQREVGLGGSGARNGPVAHRQCDGLAWGGIRLLGQTCRASGRASGLAEGIRAAEVVRPNSLHLDALQHNVRHAAQVVERRDAQVRSLVVEREGIGKRARAVGQGVAAVAIGADVGGVVGNILTLVGLDFHRRGVGSAVARIDHVVAGRVVVRAAHIEVGADGLSRDSVIARNVGRSVLHEDFVALRPVEGFPVQRRAGARRCGFRGEAHRLHGLNVVFRVAGGERRGKAQQPKEMLQFHTFNSLMILQFPTPSLTKRDGMGLNVSKTNLLT